MFERDAMPVLIILQTAGNQRAAMLALHDVCLGKPKRGLDIRVEGLLGLFNDAGQVANSKIQWSLVRRLKLIETNDGLRSSEVARFFEHLAHHGLNE